MDASYFEVHDDGSYPADSKEDLMACRFFHNPYKHEDFAATYAE
jgi:hypothetical protein